MMNIKNFIRVNDIALYGPEFDEPIDLEYITGCKKIIFESRILSNMLVNSYIDGTENKVILNHYHNKFNQIVNNLCIVKSICYIQFGRKFNQNVDNLPESLTHLEFGHEFNQNVNNLPQSLTYLKFGSDFNQSVDNLPQSLTY